jgi:hypothetical protein
MTVRPVLLLAAAVALAAGCGGNEAERQPPAPSPTGPGLTVSEALASDAEGLLLVRGALYARGAEVRLCEALAESYPPQCGVASVPLEGLSVSDVRGVQRAQGVAWTDTEIKVLGELENGVLVVSDTTLG